MRVAGLDIATTTGVCVGSPEQAPVFWSEDLGKARSHDERFANALKLCRTLVSDHGVEYIGIEAPMKARHDKKATNELLMGVIACVRGWAYIKGVCCQTFEVATIDKHFLGARMIGREARKAAIQHRCQLLGWRPATDDEADAGAVFDIMCSTLSRSHGIATSPLMAHAKGGT